jgi:hypothetical protein
VPWGSDPIFTAVDIPGKAIRKPDDAGPVMALAINEFEVVMIVFWV